MAALNTAYTRCHKASISSQPNRPQYQSKLFICLYYSTLY